jgi:hypothetical protein
MTVQKRIMLEILVLVIGIFVINLLAMKFHWYSSVWWFDMPMHTLGGLWIALASLFVYKYRRTLPNDIFYPKKLFFVALVSVLVIGFLWEVFEFGIERIGILDLASPIDSLSDICFDLIGGIVGTAYFIHRYERVIKAIDKV